MFFMSHESWFDGPARTLWDDKHRFIMKNGVDMLRRDCEAVEKA